MDARTEEGTIVRAMAALRSNLKEDIKEGQPSLQELSDNLLLFPSRLGPDGEFTQAHGPEGEERLLKAYQVTMKEASNGKVMKVTSCHKVFYGF